jgi:hypothetical protein
MNRSSAILFLPAVLLAVVAAIYVKPWNHLNAGNGPTLPAAMNAVLPKPVPATTTPTNSDQPGTGRVLSAKQLEALLQQNVLAQSGQWSCATDATGTWNYICKEQQLREVWGYNVDKSKITSSQELSYAGHKLVP